MQTKIKAYFGAGLIVVYLTCTLWANTAQAAPSHLPDDVLPVLGCWFWQEREFEPDGYKEFLDLVYKHAPYDLLTTSVRTPIKEVTDPHVHEQIKAAALYAQERDIQLAFDLDLRLARFAFFQKYPDEMQEMLILHELEPDETNETQVTIKSQDLGDHYTHRTTHYIPLNGRLERVLAYKRGPNGIKEDTLQDITGKCHFIKANKDEVSIKIPPKTVDPSYKICILVVFTHWMPDVFAPHLLEFQREILESYADVPLKGACKDEWGFPPCFDGNPEKNQFWFSKYRTAAYAERTNGRDLIDDSILMHAGIEGREQERISAINHFMAMSYERNAEIENDFYLAVKEYFGPDALVATHPTWWPYPDLREFKKNGLHWWAATRDWAQTDETTPFSVRTALAKKWQSPVWYNMYYATDVDQYIQHIWAGALAGGRVNYHPPWPSESITERRRRLLGGDLMRAECRVRLLNFITKTPLDCPVAVVFGHTCAMNWAGPGFNDVGMEIADSLWREGFPADLIPSSEIHNGSLSIDEEGTIRYGNQRYAAVVLYHPEFERPETSNFFRKAAEGRTALFQIGNWTKDFEGNTNPTLCRLPEKMQQSDDCESLIKALCKELDTQNIARQAPATDNLGGFAEKSNIPSRTGFCRLIDGTVIYTSAKQNTAGDKIEKTVKIDGTDVTFDAIGLAGIRLDKNGKLDAFMAGGLKHFKGNGIEIALEKRTDLALWKGEDGDFHGVLQEHKGTIPESLLQVTKDWIELECPAPLE